MDETFLEELIFSPETLVGVVFQASVHAPFLLVFLSPPTPEEKIRLLSCLMLRSNHHLIAIFFTFATWQVAHSEFIRTFC